MEVVLLRGIDKMPVNPILALNPSIYCQMGISEFQSHEFTVLQAGKNLSLANGFWTSHLYWMIE